MSPPRPGWGCHRWSLSSFWFCPPGQWHKDHWNRFYPWLADPEHTALGESRGKKSKMLSYRVCVYVSVWVQTDDPKTMCPSALLPYNCHLCSVHSAAGLYLTGNVWHAPSPDSDDVDDESWIFALYLTQLAPVILILADHFEVPSSTLCLICFMCVTCVAFTTANTSWMSSKISGLFLSRIFMRSLRTMMMFWVRSSAPCLELFSAAPGWGWKRKNKHS